MNSRNRIVQAGLVVLISVLTIAVVKAGELRKSFRATIPTVTAVVSHTFTEADVGPDDLAADLVGGIFTFATASSATVSVSVLSFDASGTNALTNVVSEVDMAGTVSKAWAPSTAIIVNRGEGVLFSSSDTSKIVNVRYWIK
jgi:hypothetical protein